VQPGAIHGPNFGVCKLENQLVIPKTLGFAPKKCENIKKKGDGGRSRTRTCEGIAS
jgi:hypothetical protein